MLNTLAAQIIFYVLAAITVGFAALVAFSRNIVYSAFALVGALMGVAGIYILLAADFVAMVQVLLYVGGIVVLTIFAVMLTQGIGDVAVSNRAAGPIAGLAVTVLAGAVMLYATLRTPWRIAHNISVSATTYGIGNAFLGAYVLPFEVASLVLLAALIGAVVISRQDPRGAANGEGRGLTAMGGGITLDHFLVLGLILFLLGAYCVLTRRNAIGILMGIELILNAANINYLAFAYFGGARYDGQVFAIFVIMLAAAEAVIGLAVILAIYQNLRTIDVDATETLSG